MTALKVLDLFSGLRGWTLRTEHGLNCYVTDEVGCVCGLDQALERITDVRLAATPPTPALTAAREVLDAVA